MSVYHLLTRPLKQLMPHNLFARALLILVLPTILVQAIAVYIFYERHWDSVSRQMSISLAGEITWLVERWEAVPSPRAKQRLIEQSERYMGFKVSVLKPFKLGNTAPYTDKMDESEGQLPAFEQQLRSGLKHPLNLRYLHKSDQIRLLIAFSDAVLKIEMPAKRLMSPTTFIFIAWMGGASLVFLLIAVLFLRNQIRPIILLAEAADRFGKGQEIHNFRPSGAKEIRKAGRAFMEMRERIRRQVESRTAMLAGISHDLRTPLTRMKLQLAMQPNEDSSELQQDVTEMEHMIDAYLAFARGEGDEAVQTLMLQPWLEEIIAPYWRSHRPVVLLATPHHVITFKPQAMKRVLQNLVDNALRYGKNCWVSAGVRHQNLMITVEDDGSGIPESQREHVFQAFRRLEESRNLATGGAGLGLTIVRDIVHAHGGEVVLDSSPDHKGLRATITLPL
jgi:two-component system osmolarity sensor histidine kinase EnvZ